jgi:FkbM family methyltransferase
MLDHGFLFSGRSQYFKKSGYEPYQTSLVIELLSRVSIFVNVGAHHGYYCCLALSRDIPTIAFEPHPINAAMLKKHINANCFAESLTLIEAAVGANESRSNLFGGGFTGSLINIHPNVPIGEFHEVDVVTLNDKVNLNAKALFVMDIEGFELEALKGATKLLVENHYWIIEILPDHENEVPFSHVFSFMNSYNYTAYGISEKSLNLYEISLELAKKIERNQERTDCTNFLFVQKNDELITTLSHRVSN